MSAGELLLTLFVALIVFGPNKLPMLATHMGKLFRILNRCRNRLADFWQEQLNEQQLQDNTRKAEQADALYNHDKP
ncbi:Sec-independent protein translocase subunit TatA/TatB [Legionella spiritensis]|uniref:TatB protein (Twin arginine translocation) n=1 Tax=Legionella spiritensis TaxID=452 RepID=A0A0W0YX24_LEGSP|nr:twin-arginine translocase TatA/TatE family subunit [Legionella spiritensis]KTD61231.1 TatB protein (twin arginine translocation) [Legionella spiritensis]SNV27895.1 sec-independent protein translocase protein TatB [Legionella spiritensis]VEG91634.1 sec-independent protein translocase protein TatB [Legionella spiritensis]